MTGLSYPPAARLNLTETFHGREVSDPYRWLEDPGSPQTRAWLQAQDELYAGYLAGLSGRERFAARLAELLAAGAVGTPVWRGQRQFYTRREADQEHAVLYTATARACPGEPAATARASGRWSTRWRQIRPAPPRWTAGSPIMRAGCWPTSCQKAAGKSPCCESWTSAPAWTWTAPSTAAGIRRWPGCPAGRRSTTAVGSPQPPSRLARSSITAGFTCIGWARQ